MCMRNVTIKDKSGKFSNDICEKILFKSVDDANEYLKQHDLRITDRSVNNKSNETLVIEG